MIGRIVTPVLRTVPWIGFVPASVVALVMAHVAGQQPVGTGFRFLPTRVGILAITIAAGFVFDDPAMPTTDPAPSPLRLRRMIRVMAALSVATLLFTLVISMASHGMDLVATASVHSSETGLEAAAPRKEFPWGRLALETATMIGFVLAAAALVRRRGQTEPGRTATSIFLGAYAVTWMVTESHRPWADPSDQRWHTGAGWWWSALILAWLTVIVLSWDSRAGIRILRSQHRSAQHQKSSETAHI